MRWAVESITARSVASVVLLFLAPPDGSIECAVDDVEAAIGEAKRAIRSYPDFPNTYRWLAAALGQADRAEDAKEILEKAIVIAPASFDQQVRQRVPWMRPEDHAHMLEGLRKAGWEG